MSMYEPRSEEWVVIDFGYGCKMLLTSEHGHPECKDGVAWIDSDGEVAFEGECLPYLTEIHVVKRGWTTF